MPTRTRTWFSDVLVEPLAMLVALVVLAAQLIVGGCLLTNRFVRPALRAGIVLNLAFTMAGNVPAAVRPDAGTRFDAPARSRRDCRRRPVHSRRQRALRDCDGGRRRLR